MTIRSLASLAKDGVFVRVQKYLTEVGAANLIPDLKKYLLDRNRVDRSGERHGRFTILCRVPRPTKKRAWKCKCDCGRIFVIGDSAVYGHTKSCGCLRSEMILKGLRYSHGEANKTAEYRIWSGMRNRCLNPSNKSFSNYGGRGIKCADEWCGKTGFANFLANMGRRPSPHHSLDRIDNDGDYAPGNCRWATKKQQSNNRRPRRLQLLCKRGHPLSGANLYVCKTHRTCRRCIRLRRQLAKQS